VDDPNDFPNTNFRQFGRDIGSLIAVQLDAIELPSLTCFTNHGGSGVDKDANSANLGKFGGQDAGDRGSLVQVKPSETSRVSVQAQTPDPCGSCGPGVNQIGNPTDFGQQKITTHGLTWGIVPHELPWRTNVKQTKIVCLALNRPSRREDLA
jgi:hypothetical protein